MTLAEMLTEDDVLLCADLRITPCRPDHIATALGRTWVVPGHKLEQAHEMANVSQSYFYVGVDKWNKVWINSNCDQLRDLQCGYILTVPPERGAI